MKLTPIAAVERIASDAISLAREVMQTLRQK